MSGHFFFKFLIYSPKYVIWALSPQKNALMTHPTPPPSWQIGQQSAWFCSRLPWSSGNVNVEYRLSIKTDFFRALSPLTRGCILSQTSLYTRSTRIPIHSGQTFIRELYVTANQSAPPTRCWREITRTFWCEDNILDQIYKNVLIFIETVFFYWNMKMNFQKNL